MAERRLGEVFERRAGTVDPDVPAALREVHSRARRRTTRRRTVAALACVGVVLVAGVTATLMAPGSLRGDDPVVPPPPHEDSAPVTVVRRVSAADLGLRKLLSAAVGADGRVYVTDSSQQVAELTPDLEVVRTWGSSGAGDGQFRLVQGAIAVGPDGSVYVSDTGNFRVQVFTADGRYVRSLGEFGNGPGQLTWPFDLAVDADGFVYVADDKEETLAKLTPSGKQVWRIGGIGETDPRLQGHQHLAMIDAEGRAVVTNDDAGVVVLIAPDGSVAEAPFGESFSSGDLCDTTEHAGLFYLTTCTTPSPLAVYDADGALVGTVAEAGLAQSPRWGLDSTGYAVTADGGLVELEARTD
jgi:sugar lactone lactonase YvrE